MSDFLLTHGSYLLIIVVLILTGAGLPVPEEAAIIPAGVLSSHGLLNPWLAAASCLFGALAGDCVMYWIGYHFGRRVIREHHWWTRFINPEREARIEAMMQDHGLKLFFLARFLVGLRSPVYLSAGILRVSFRRFMLIDLFCATMVIGVFFSLSYFFGTAIAEWVRRAEVLLTIVVVAVVAGVAIFYWRRHHRRLIDTVLEPDDAPPAAAEGREEPANEIEHVA